MKDYLKKELKHRLENFKWFLKIVRCDYCDKRLKEFDLIYIISEDRIIKPDVVNSYKQSISKNCCKYCYSKLLK